jgi:hypothetical protein
MGHENLHCQIARFVENSGPGAIQYVCTMKLRVFEWDEEDKAGRNYRKHGVRMPERFQSLTILMPLPLPIKRAIRRKRDLCRLEWEQSAAS